MARLAPDILRRRRCGHRVLADEPTAHQDADHADRVLGALRERAERGGACVVATHDTRLLPLLDRVLRLHDGQLVG